MEHTPVSEQFTRLDKLVAESTGSGYDLNVTFVYEDAATRKWAREVFDRATKVAGDQSMRATWWKINDLSAAGVLAGAVSTAMRADVIVIATASCEGLPLPFYVWANSWLEHRSGKPGAIVALFGCTDNPTAQSGRLISYLGQVAKQCRMDLICESRILEALPAAA
jgi:hypothetical protein